MTDIKKEEDLVSEVVTISVTRKLPRSYVERERFKMLYAYEDLARKKGREKVHRRLPMKYMSVILDADVTDLKSQGWFESAEDAYAAYMKTKDTKKTSSKAA